MMKMHGKVSNDLGSTSFGRQWDQNKTDKAVYEG